MVNKCANPACGAPFVRFTGGRVFGIEHVSTDHGRFVEFFWMCEKCAQTMTLAFDENQLPLAIPAGREGHAAETAAA